MKQSEVLTQLVNVLEQDLYFVELCRFQFQTSTSRGKGGELFKIKVEILPVL